jgi:cytochrome P450
MLAEHLQMQQQLRERPQDIDVFVEEVLRLESPFRQMMRSVPHDTPLGGFDVAAGCAALLRFAAGKRDPAQYSNPDVVDLGRGSPRQHPAFGHASTIASGPHWPGSKPGPYSKPF